MGKAIVLLSIFAVLSTVPVEVRADKPANLAEKEVLSQARIVAEYMDLGEYAAARDELQKGLKNLKTAGSAVRPIAAQTHAMLGVVHVLGFKNTKEATKHFEAAIKIQKDIALPKQADTRSKIVFAKAYETIHPTIDCNTLMGLYHQAVPLAQEGMTTVIEAKLDKLLVPGTIQVMYRGADGGAYQEALMSHAEGCTFRGEIPADKVNAPKIEYYLEARVKDGRPSARKGKSKEPFVVNVSFGPVADAPAPKVAAAPVEPEAPTPEPATEPKVDEVEDLLLTQPKEPRGSGCAGCSTGSQTAPTWWLLGLVMLFLRRRRRA